MSKYLIYYSDGYLEFLEKDGESYKMTSHSGEVIAAMYDSGNGLSVILYGKKKLKLDYSEASILLQLFRKHLGLDDNAEHYELQQEGESDD